jgi:hypothetical protein
MQRNRKNKIQKKGGGSAFHQLDLALTSFQR